MSPARRVFATLLVLATLFLIWMGAQVKSHEAGLAVPDWPLSYGRLWPPMVGGTFHEHWHRTVASGVGLLAIVMAVWAWRWESRAWVRRLAWLGLGAVVLQGLLGGLTVKGLLPTAVSAGHGTLAQMVACLLAWLAAAQSREWCAAEARAPLPSPGVDAGRARAGLRAAAVGLLAAWVQLVLGAWMRHSEAGLAVPFFPVSPDGAWWPAHVDQRVVVHMLHRGFALVAAFLLWRGALRAGAVAPALWRHGALLAGLVGLQLALGASVIWTGKAPVITSLHVTNGAVILVLAWLLVLRCWRLGAAGSRGTPAARASRAGGSAPAGAERGPVGALSSSRGGER